MDKFILITLFQKSKEQLFMNTHHINLRFLKYELRKKTYINSFLFLV